MGCCGISIYPRNQQIDAAQNRMDLMKALKNLITEYDTEIKEIQEHLSKGTPLKNDNLSNLDKPSLQKRTRYLGELADCYQRVITAINKCNDNMDLKKAKDLIQSIIGRYYCAYDETRQYKKDEEEFMKFANENARK